MNAFRRVVMMGRAAVTAPNIQKRCVAEATSRLSAAEQKALLDQVGPTNPLTLYVKLREGKGKQYKQLAEEYRALGRMEKQALFYQAKDNLAVRKQIMNNLGLTEPPRPNRKWPKEKAKQAD
eukprot:TRINITY_DN15748_c0_g1_i1.p1 TRINITY_DN15748_c0_g1~~TRINITY_DN15748_c0_g1_i1.p1  ORF type:complete len:122 (+),score=7.50 TRINITY_DN15748_c0_g1_i1:102-467(+)